MPRKYENGFTIINEDYVEFRSYDLGDFYKLKVYAKAPQTKNYNYVRYNCYVWFRKDNLCMIQVVEETTIDELLKTHKCTIID